MQIHAFKGRGRVFGFTRQAQGSNLPERFGPWTPFKRLDMESGQSLPGVDVDTCLADVEAHGLHLTDAHVRITEQAIRPAP